MDFDCGRQANIFGLKNDANADFVILEGNRPKFNNVDLQPSAMVRNISLSRQRSGLNGRSSSPPGFRDGLLGRYSRALRVDESPDQQNKPEPSQYGASERSPEHPFGPASHILLGLKIVVSALIFSGALWFGFKGFKRASEALDTAVDGVKYSWCLVALWFFLSLAGAGLASGVVTYWLSVYGPG